MTPIHGVVIMRNGLVDSLSRHFSKVETLFSESMKEGLKDWLPFYKECPSHLRLQLQRMSASTLARYVNEVRETLETRRGLSTTSPALYIKKSQSRRTTTAIWSKKNLKTQCHAFIS
jgi:hypothetical protein